MSHDHGYSTYARQIAASCKSFLAEAWTVVWSAGLLCTVCGFASSVAGFPGPSALSAGIIAVSGSAAPDFTAVVPDSGFALG
ncbi:hypothetical protein D3C81_2046660 [compost metagenome]